MTAPDIAFGVARTDAVDRRLIDRLHGELPLTERPFADVGRELGLSEAGAAGALARDGQGG